MTTWWLDIKNGNDENGGLSPETAFKTPEKVDEAIAENFNPKDMEFEVVFEPLEEEVNQ